MKSFTSNGSFLKSLFPRLALASLLAAGGLPAFAQQTPRTLQPTPPQQQPQPTPQQQQPQDDPAEDVLRVSTSLVQTDVSVVDKKGQFFEGLGREQFELKVDGRVQPVLFFERITAGSSTEAARIAAARGERIDVGAAVSPVERGRTVIFFVDDLHLTPEGVARAREMLLKFIEGDMTPGMEVLISSASGQIGFLQQFTNDRAVLRAAARRLKYRSQASLDTERPPMTEYQALAVDRGDQGLLEYLIQQVIFENSPNTFPRNMAESMIRNRARRIRRQAALLSTATISTLEGVVRARGGAAGRQTLFYISHGFTFDNEEADARRKLQRVIDAAARSGTVVYTVDARGLAVSMQDASSAGVPDLARESGSLTANAYSGYNASAELSASQEVLRGLAEDTGGRALLNTNALEAAVTKTLSETADYYLLAWRPEGIETGTSGAPKFHKIEISIKGRPDLKVRVRSGFLDARVPRVAAATTPPSAANAPTTTIAAVPNATNVALNNALNAPSARRELPVDAYPVFTNDAQGASVINASVQLTNDRLKFAPVAASGGKTQAQVEVVCSVLDDKGKGIYSNGRTLTLGGNESNTAANGAGEKSRGKLVTNFSIPVLAPGLYQVRAVARDANSGLIGSAFEWVEVPDLKANRLALSSLLVTERRRANTQATAANTGATATTAAMTQPPDILRVERRFARSSHALLQLYIYNATRKAAGDAPDVELEIKILRDKRTVMNAPPHKVSLAAGSDPARIFYVAEMPLGAMTPGVYLLQVTVTDRTAKTSAVRELDFYVE
jgi:VWFA-related protein